MQKRTKAKTIEILKIKYYQVRVDKKQGRAY